MTRIIAFTLNLYFSLNQYLPLPEFTSGIDWAETHDIWYRDGPFF